MTRRSIFLAAFVLTLINVASTSAQTQSFVADTGLLSLKRGQILRVTVATVGSETVTVRFKFGEYVDLGTTGGIVRKQLASQIVTDTVTIGPDQAAAIDVYVKIDTIRGEAESTSRNLKVNAFVVTPSTSSGGNDIPTQQISFNFAN